MGLVANPTYSRSYLIPNSDLSLDERSALRSSVDKQVIDMAQGIGSKPLGMAIASLVVRDIEPTTDLAAAFGANYAWLIANAGVLAAETTYIANTNLVPQTAVLAFFGCTSLMATPNLSRLRFTFGTGGTSMAVFQLEQMYSSLEVKGYFSQSIPYPNQAPIGVFVWPKVAFAANTEYLVLFGRLCEGLGNQISLPTY